MATELHLLGPPSIVRSVGQAVAVRGHKAWGLLAYLALRPAGVRCVFRTNVTARFGSVTAEFGSVTGRSGDVTGEVFAPA